MNNVKLRRIALTFAAVCFGISGILLLFCNIAFPSLLQASPQASIKRTSEQRITLPCCVSGTDLWIKNLASYDGVFIEDGSNTEVFDTASVVIENKSGDTVLYAQIEIRTEDRSFLFEAMMLPPGSSTLIPEKNGQRMPDSEIVYCSGWSVSAQQSSSQQLQIHSIDMGTIEVINLCNEPLSDVKIYHKTYLADSDIYIGGKAIETSIAALLPGESLQLKPELYASGYSKIVYIS